MEIADIIVERETEGYFAYHRSALTSPEIHRAEIERIFNRSWLYVGHESEVPNRGDFVRRTVGLRPLFFVRSQTTGEVNVFYNSCTHRGATICRRDRGNGKTFQCFYHAWTFDSDGKLIGVPDEECFGPVFDKSKHGLVQVPRQESYRGLIFVSYDPHVEELTDYLAGAREYIDAMMDAAEVAATFAGGSNGDGSGEASTPLQVLRGTHQYAIKANWKLLVENSFDGYHLGPTHATYFQFLKDQNVEVSPSTGSMKLLGNGHAVIEYTGSWGRPIARWASQFGDASKAQLEALRERIVAELGDTGYRMAELNRNLFIYPNLFVMDNNATALRVIEPTSVDYMDVAQHELAPRIEDPTVRKVRLESYVTFAGPGGLATPDDVEALESCQQGARSGVEWSLLSRGYFSEEPPMSGELQMRVFWRRWQQQLLAGEPVPA
ncbi:MAG TPA: aromatic ring-hydroxylating dioxygenase subunit alpha [Gaiellaceae bacterium]|jgi:p-cumate 2,3-dioxygenase subunit alpha